MADNPPREIQTLIDNHINGFNTQDHELFLSVFGDTAIIIDGIAPYRWLNPNAPANWIADSDKWRKDLGVSYEKSVIRNGVLQCVRRRSGEVHGHHQGPNCRSDWHSRLYIFKARRGVEDRRAGVGAHVLSRSSAQQTRPANDAHEHALERRAHSDCHSTPARCLRRACPGAMKAAGRGERI